MVPSFGFGFAVDDIAKSFIAIVISEKKSCFVALLLGLLLFNSIGAGAWGSSCTDTARPVSHKLHRKSSFFL